MPTVVGVLVECTCVVLPTILFNRVETHLKQVAISRYIHSVVFEKVRGALLGVWGIIVLVLPSC